MSKKDIKIWERDIGDKLWGNCFGCNKRINALEFLVDNNKIICRVCSDENKCKIKKAKIISNEFDIEDYIVYMS
jgi:hypothetical protein